MDQQVAINSLNGQVQSQGVKIDARDWLDMGSPNWVMTREEDKARAYQAAICLGWTENGLKKIMIDAWGPRLDEDMANVTLEYLREVAQKHPAEIEELSTPDAKPPVFKIQGVDKTFEFPTKEQ